MFSYEGTFPLTSAGRVFERTMSDQAMEIWRLMFVAARLLM